MVGHQFAANASKYIGVTPGGCFYAVQSWSNERTRDFLLRLLNGPETPPFSPELAMELSGMEEKDAFEFVHWLEGAGFIYGSDVSESMPQENLETLLSTLLPEFSDQGRAVLTDSGKGLYLGASGFTRDIAEELAAMSSGLLNLYRSNHRLIEKDLGIQYSALGLIDPAGNSELGFWPLYVGDNQFTLILSGVPQLNRDSFKQLIWVLVVRYGLS